MENGMPKLSLAFAAVLTMGLCFAQSGACAQTAEDMGPLTSEPPEAAEQPEAPIEDPVEDIDNPGAGGLIDHNLGVGRRIEMRPDECAEMPSEQGC
jgi:hypothetical protein